MANGAARASACSHCKPDRAAVFVLVEVRLHLPAAPLQTLGERKRLSGGAGARRLVTLKAWNGRRGGHGLHKDFILTLVRSALRWREATPGLAGRGSPHATEQQCAEDEEGGEEEA